MDGESPPHAIKSLPVSVSTWVVGTRSGHRLNGYQFAPSQAVLDAHGFKKPRGALLFLHGFGAGSSADEYQLICSQIARHGYRVYAPEAVGHGFTAGTFSYDLMAEHVSDALEKLARDENERFVVLFGHSLQGVAALDGYLRHVKRVQAAEKAGEAVATPAVTHVLTYGTPRYLKETAPVRFARFKNWFGQKINRVLDLPVFGRLGSAFRTYRTERALALMRRRMHVEPNIAPQDVDRVVNELKNVPSTLSLLDAWRRLPREHRPVLAMAFGSLDRVAKLTPAYEKALRRAGGFPVRVPFPHAPSLRKHGREEVRAMGNEIGRALAYLSKVQDLKRAEGLSAVLDAKRPKKTLKKTRGATTKGEKK